MAQTTTTAFYKIIGSLDLADGTVEHTLMPVADATGAPAKDATAPSETYIVQRANEQPRGTIVKVVTVTNRAITLNPTPAVP